jgi:hypothetical protein
VSPISAAGVEDIPASLDYTQSQWDNLAESAKPAVAEHLAKDYLTEDTTRIFGKDMLGNPAPEWVLLREQSAEQVFGVREGDILANDPAAVKIREYANGEGFIEKNGYVPERGEKVEQFLKRVHILRVLAGGPRSETH